MKKILIFPLLCVATLINAQLPIPVNEAQITFTSTEHNFGQVEQTAKGEYIYCEFTVTNTGDSPLIVSKCEGSCGCTVPECATEPIAPGKTSIIKVRYDSSRLGSFTKSVIVNSNAANSPVQTLTIIGTVIG